MAEKKQKKANIQFLNQELKRIATILADNDRQAAFLIEETKKEALNALIPVNSERRMLKLLAKQVEKLPETGNEYFLRGGAFESLKKVDQQGRLLLVLHYYKGYNIQKIARIIGFSEKEGKQLLMSTLMQWKSGQTRADLQHLKQQLRTELDYMVVEETSEGKRPFQMKRLAPIITLFMFFLIGGTGSQALKAEAEVSPGIDIMEIYKESTRMEETYDEINEAITAAGYKDVYFSVDREAEYAYLSIEGKDNEDKQEEIISFVDEEMQERSLDYFMETNFYIPDEGTDMEVDEETAISEEISEKLTEALSDQIMDQFVVNEELYLLGISWTADAWYIEIPEEIKKAEDISRHILDEYEDKRRLVIEEYSYNDYEKSFRWGNVIDYINTALNSSEKYTFKEIIANPEDGVMKFDVKLYLFKTDKDAESIAREVVRSITRFLETSEIKELTGDDPYEIIVKDNSNKVIKTD